MVFEPEPAPSNKQNNEARCSSLIHQQLGRELSAAHQQLQLSADLAQLRSPLAPTAPFFARLSEKTRIDAGRLMDLLLQQGDQVTLPAIQSPCPNMACNSAGAAALTAALEASVQLEDSKQRAAFAEAARESGDSEARRLAEELYFEHRQVRQMLVRHLAVVERFKDDQGATLTYAPNLQF